MNRKAENAPKAEAEGGRKRIGLYPLLPLILWLVATAGTTLLFPSGGSFRFSEYEVGSISRDEVIAPFTFEILKSEEELAAEREAARQSVDPVFVRRDSVQIRQVANLRGVLRATARARDTLRPYYRRGGADFVEKRREMLARIREEYDARINESSWIYLLGDLRRRSTRSQTPLTADLLATVLGDVYARGVIDRPVEEIDAPRGQIRLLDEGEERTVPVDQLLDLEAARAEAGQLLTEMLADRVAPGDTAINVGYELLASFIKPNIVFDAEETSAREEAAVAKVPIVEGIVLKDERIIDSNEKITQEHRAKLRSLEMKRVELARREGGLRQYLPWAGRALFAGLIFFFFGYWFRRFRPDIYRKPNRLALLWVMTVMMVAFWGLVFQGGDLNALLFPAALSAVILTIVFDARAALLQVLALSLIIGGLRGNELFAVLVVFFPAALSVFTVMRVRTRVQIMRASALIFLGYLLVVGARRMLSMQFDMTALQDLLFIVVNSLATPLVALGMLIIIELVFRVTSDLTLLELADLNRPLLKRLSLEAPGTYHHSIMVGNLAEAGAEAIHANALLVRAGAYYHDIGKMDRRNYFVENQSGGGNIHDSLDPEESAEVVSDHVTQGVRIAEQYHLPEAIKAFIREHHGTSLMVFFYNKALELRPEGKVDEQQFRYPGPKPQSKETGILMLADSAEAATRSLEDPSPEKILEVVRGVIISKYSDGELDECPLTLNDLRRVMEAFVPILQGIHHHRIRYPSRDEVEQRRQSAKERKQAKEEAGS